MLDFAFLIGREVFNCFIYSFDVIETTMKSTALFWQDLEVGFMPHVLAHRDPLKIQWRFTGSLGIHAEQ